MSNVHLRGQHERYEQETRAQNSPTIRILDADKTHAAIIARLNSPNLNPEERKQIVAALESQRETLMNQYVTAYRKLLRDNHKLHPTDPWHAAKKIQEAIQPLEHLTKQHNDIVDILDEHAPVFRLDTTVRLNAHLANLPPGHRKYVEETLA